MGKYGALAKKMAEEDRLAEANLQKMEALACEYERKAILYENAGSILEEIDQEFSSITGLNRQDVLFLFFAVAMHCGRIYLINKVTEVRKAGNENEIEKWLHKIQEKLLKGMAVSVDEEDRLYYAAINHIVKRPGVPYDAQTFLNGNKLPLFSGPGKEKGANHRFATLGHDPTLGILFGTANIMTNTISCVRRPIRIGKFAPPVLTVNHVHYDTDYKNPKIGAYGSTAIMFGACVERTSDEPAALVASLIKQFIHIGTDLYTPCGIQIPGANLVLSKPVVEELTKHLSTGDILKISASEKTAEFINLLVGAIYMLMYDPASDIPRDLHEVKSRKIITLANLIATGSNVIAVSVLSASGDVSPKNLDAGGAITTINRLIYDKQFITEVKEEFIRERWRELILNDEATI